MWLLLGMRDLHGCTGSTCLANWHRCSFVCADFLAFINQAMTCNRKYGVRIHCGENVRAARPRQPGYPSFISHVYTTVIALEYLSECLQRMSQEQSKPLSPPFSHMRIGYGTVFSQIHPLFDETEPEGCRGFTSIYSVLHQTIIDKGLAIFDLSKPSIPFEINTTCPLGFSASDPFTLPLVRLGQLSADMHIKLILCTDTDGVTPLDSCPFRHQFHHSLAGEVCRFVYLHSPQPNLESLVLHTVAQAREFAFFEEASRSALSRAVSVSVPDPFLPNEIDAAPSLHASTADKKRSSVSAVPATARSERLRMSVIRSSVRLPEAGKDLDDASFLPMFFKDIGLTPPGPVGHRTRFPSRTSMPVVPPETLSIELVSLAEIFQDCFLSSDTDTACLLVLQHGSSDGEYIVRIFYSVLAVGATAAASRGPATKPSVHVGDAALENVLQVLRDLRVIFPALLHAEAVQVVLACFSPILPAALACETEQAVFMPRLQQACALLRRCTINFDWNFHYCDDERHPAARQHGHSVSSCDFTVERMYDHLDSEHGPHLYFVICDHAGAATSALNLIAKLFSESALGDQMRSLPLQASVYPFM